LPEVIFLFNNAVKKVEELIDRNVLGDCSFISCTWQQHLNPMKEPDILLDLGVHAYSILRSWNFKPGCGKVDLTPRRDHCIVVTKSGKTRVELHLSWLVGPKKREVKVIGEKGLIVLDALNQEISVFDEHEQLIGCKRQDTLSEQSDLDLDFQVNNTLRDELLEFLRQIDESPDWKLAKEATDFLRWKECFYAVGGLK
jgi:predicted dehydrogenase